MRARHSGSATGGRAACDSAPRSQRKKRTTESTALIAVLVFITQNAHAVSISFPRDRLPLGRALPGLRQPGLTCVNPFTDRLRKVNMHGDPLPPV